MNFIHGVGVLTAVAAACAQAQADGFKLENGLKVKIDAVITLGTRVRANDASPDAYGSTPSKVVDRDYVSAVAGMTS